MKERRPIDELYEIGERDRDFLGSTRVSRVGRCVSRRRTFLDALFLFGFRVCTKSSRRRDAFASTRHGRAPQSVQGRVTCNGANSKKLGFRRSVFAPIDSCSICPSVFKREELFLARFGRMFL